jgi:hypothetical protein
MTLSATISIAPQKTIATNESTIEIISQPSVKMLASDFPPANKQAGQHCVDRSYSFHKINREEANCPLPLFL